MQPDSLIPDPSNPQAWNRYSYVGNNPVNFNDPTGHKPCGDGEKWECGTGRRQDPDENPYPNWRRNIEEEDDEGSGLPIIPYSGPCVSVVCLPTSTPTLPISPTIPSNVPPQTPAPPFDLGLSVQIPYLIIDYIKDFNSMSPIAWRKSVTIANAFNPDPRWDVAIGAVGQGLTDAFNPNLSAPQRVERVLVTGFESGLTGLASDAIGAGIALLGGGVGGYAGGQVISSLLIDNVVWANYNHKNFGAAGY